MAACKVERFVAPLQTTHHRAAFESAGNQRSQFPGVDIGPDLAPSLPLLHNRSQTIKPRTESSPRLRSQLRIAIVGIDGRVHQRTASWQQPSAPVPKVLHVLYQAINRIWDLLSSFEARIHCEIPSVVEGVSRKLLFAFKMSIDAALF